MKLVKNLAREIATQSTIECNLLNQKYRCFKFLLFSAFRLKLDDTGRHPCNAGLNTCLFVLNFSLYVII